MTARTPPLVRGFVAGHLLAGPVIAAIFVARSSPWALASVALFLIALATWRQLP